MVWLLSLLFISVFPILYALCEEGQIDINTASAEELDKLQGIGPVKAQAIINARPFNSTDSLIDVNGIGEATLNKIKLQGIACVDKELEEEVDEEPKENVKKDENKSEKTNEEIENKSLEKTFKETIIDNSSETKEVLELSFQDTKPETIKLIPQTIKTEENSSYKNRNVVYMLVSFCFLLAFLFFLRGRKHKNEFR